MSNSVGKARAGQVCVGMILGAHGLRGALRVKSYTVRPQDIAAYGPLSDAEGARRFDLKIVGAGRNGLVMAGVKGVEDRNAAEALAGTRLHVDRDRLPALVEDDEYYHSDLIGLRAESLDGSEIGTVTGMFDFGAGDVLEVKGPNGRRMVPFTKIVVPVVDLPGGRLVIDLPVEVDGEVEANGEGDAG